MQREASEAYIKSQTHEGWSLVRARYDDGGFSGGSMERPRAAEAITGGAGQTDWDQVQQSLEDHLAAKTERRERQSTNALLVGKLFDDRGNLMTPSWSKRLSYYVSQAILSGDKANAGSVARVSAPEIESRVIEAIGSLTQEQNAYSAHRGHHRRRHSSG
jgi:hypothetical protein